MAPGAGGVCSVAIRLPTPLSHLSNTPGRIPTYQLSDPIGWNHLADEWRAQVSSHQAVGYAIRLDAERNRWYITASWSLPQGKTPTVEEAAQSGRCLAVDVNSGHLDARILDTHGNPVGRPVRKEIPQKGSSSHRLGALREAVSQLVKWAKQQGASVVTDGSRPYRAAIQSYLPGSRHVLDRFHAARWFTQGLTLVRRELQRRQPPGVKPAYEPDLFRARFCLLKRNDHLTPADQRRLQRLFAAHPRLKVAWDALQELYGLYEANDLQGALESPRPFRGPLQHRSHSRVPRHRGHHPQLDRRNPQLAPRQMVQRTPRRHQQPPTNPPQNRTRVHQPPQLRRPRPITNMIHATIHPKKTRRANKVVNIGRL